MTNLLTVPSIRAHLSDGAVETLSLPEVYAAMAAERVVAFPALRPHQRHAWHAFLAQLATIAMHRAERSAQPETAEEWCGLLRALTPGHTDDEPWRLVVADPARPAFMQCPALKGLDDYRGRAVTPDDLDVLVTAKNHDVKQTIALDAAPEDWVFALISLQTMAGFLGAGNYGIARMNGGFSARPCLGLAPSEGGAGAHLFHDVRRMLAGRGDLMAHYPDYYRPQNGRELLWLEPWDGTGSADLRDLDPYFIEICRRVRLREDGGAMTAWTAPSKGPRVTAKAAKGAIGDFWAPINIKEGKALSVSAAGFPYNRLVDLVFDHTTYCLPPAMDVGGASVRGPWQLIARSVAGGQGKTDGYHERTDIAFAHETGSALLKTGKRNELAAIAKAQIEEIGEVIRALRYGIAVAASGGKAAQDLSKADRAYANPFARRLDADADARFFPALEDRFRASDKTAAGVHRAGFARHLIGVAQALLDEAIETVPCTSIRRHRARAKATSAFWGRLRRENNVFSDQPEIFGLKEANDGD